MLNYSIELNGKLDYFMGDFSDDSKTNEALDETLEA